MITKYTCSGNAAIFIALFEAKKHSNKVIVPDQGGWISYETYPALLNLKVEKLKTDYGIINPTDLENYKDCILLYSSSAAYIAEQDVKKIYEIAKKNNIKVILDITASIKDIEEAGDYIVASFGHWKPVNLGFGGMIKAETLSKIGSITKFPETMRAQLKQNLKSLPIYYQNHYELQQKVKNDLKHLDVIHKDKKGLNVIVKFKNEEELNEIIDYCNKHNYPYVKCPKDIKVLTDAISIELKR